MELCSHIKRSLFRNCDLTTLFVMPIIVAFSKEHHVPGNNSNNNGGCSIYQVIYVWLVQNSNYKFTTSIVASIAPLHLRKN